MKRFFLIALISFFTFSAFSQELPQPSPKAKVKQRVGLTDISIKYSSPGVKGREIFGELVPFDKVWRTGANKVTTIEFSQDVKVQGKDVPAGKYSFLTVPGKNKWELILNKNTELWGTRNYKKKQDLIRVEVEPVDLPEKRERMTFLVSDFDENSARIDLEWDRTRVSFNMETNTDEQAMANIEETFSEVPGKYANAARYALRAEKHYEEGLEWAETSIDLDQGWYNTWIKAELLIRLNRTEEAYEAMKKAKELGDEADRFFYRDKVEEQLEKLEKKVGG